MKDKDVKELLEGLRGAPDHQILLGMEIYVDMLGVATVRDNMIDDEKVIKAFSKIVDKIQIANIRRYIALRPPPVGVGGAIAYKKHTREKKS